jgi:deoxyhypusine synthase
VLTILLLTEKALTVHDVQRVAHLHDPDPVRVHVLVPSHDDHSELSETVDDLARTDFREAFHDADAGKSEADLTREATTEYSSSVAALLAAGVAEADGQVITGHPVDAVVKIAGEIDPDEIMVLTEPHLLADFTRRDWATRIRHAVNLPVLHIVLGTDQIVS